MQIYSKLGALTQTLDVSKELARGGEGMVIDHGKEVAKIYLPGIRPISEVKFNELQDLSSNIFIKPKTLAYNISGKVIGYFMEKVPSDHFPILSMFNKTFCARENISDKVKLNIVERLIDAMNFAHSKGIVIGDFNPYNILVNSQGSVFLIDVDSYGTKSVKHSGILFDEIRDYLYGGAVSKEADYFSLSVIIFNLLTYVHPFKGIHKKVPKMSERMLKKMPIFKTDPELFVPKCYSPLSNKFLHDQFVELYEQGKRFVLSPKTTTVVAAPKKVVTLIAQQLNMLEILTNTNVIRTACTRNRLSVTLENETLVYNVSSKGVCNVSQRLLTKPSDRVFLSDNYIYILKDNILYLLGSDYVGVVIVKDFSKEAYIKVKQFGNSLLVITSSMKYEYALNEVFRSIPEVKTTNVFGGRFVNINGLFTRVDSSTVLFYDKNKVVNSVILNKGAKDVYQTKDVGIIQCLEADKVVTKYFKIDKLQIELFDCGFEGLRYFDKLSDDLLIVPQDDELELVHSANMATIAKYQCSAVSTDSVIHCCNAGIIIVNPDGVYLANKK